MSTICSYCKREISRNRGGVAKHQKTCIPLFEHRQKISQQHQELVQGYQEAFDQVQTARYEEGTDGPIPWHISTNYPEPSDDPIDIGFGGDTNLVPGDSNAELMEEESQPAYMEFHYHQRTGLPPKRMRLEDLVLRNPLNVPNARPWAPFPKLVDFEFTEQLITDGRSKASVSRLLRDLHNGKFAEACKISFKNGKQLFSCLDEVANVYEKFKRENFEFSFRRSNGTNIQLKYSVWVKDGMAWMRELFRDPALKEQWTWFGHKKYLHIPGKQPERVIDEPLSGDAAWEIEGQLDQGTQQVQVPLILYSDKSDVARFASLSVWPVLIRLASLPKHLSNKNSAYAGNTMIGFLPKIKAPEGETHNPNWPGFGRTVLHESLKRILKPFQRASKDGYSVDCADGSRRDIVPIFSIITQDLEEQYTTALTRGNNALFPCPRCHVPKAEQHNLIGAWKLRTQSESKAIHQEALKLHQAGDKKKAEDLLKSQGLYLVENAWWSLSRCEVHQALSFDPLHTLWLGIWGRHLWPLLLEAIPKESHYDLNERAASAPSYPNMIRVHEMSSTEYADGKRYFSLIQQILPLAHDLVSPMYHPLLRLIRILLEICMFAQFRWQTTSRLEKGRELVIAFGIQMNSVVPLFPKKNWDFPKLHQLVHLILDILRKGPTEYSTCIVGENYHQGLIQAYRASNKKNAAEQILRAENRILAISRIRWKIQFGSSPGQAPNPNLEEREATDDVYDTEDVSSLMGITLKSPAGRCSTQRIDQRRGFFTDHLNLATFDGFARDLDTIIM